jgi:hypothetical protein
MRNLCQTDPIVYQDLPGGIKAGPEIYIYIDTTIVIFQAGHEIYIDSRYNNRNLSETLHISLNEISNNERKTNFSISILRLYDGVICRNLKILYPVINPMLVTQIPRL